LTEYLLRTPENSRRSTHATLLLVTR
jgi:hypothetical protein